MPSSGLTSKGTKDRRLRPFRGAIENLTGASEVEGSQGSLILCSKGHDMGAKTRAPEGRGESLKGWVFSQQIFVVSLCSQGAEGLHQTLCTQCTAQATQHALWTWDGMGFTRPEKNLRSCSIVHRTKGGKTCLRMSQLN